MKTLVLSIALLLPWGTLQAKKIPPPTLQIFADAMKATQGQELFRAITGRYLPSNFHSLSESEQSQQQNFFTGQIQSLESEIELDVHQALTKISQGTQVDIENIATGLRDSWQNSSISARKILKGQRQQTLINHTLNNNLKRSGGTDTQKFDSAEIAKLAQEFHSFVQSAPSPLYLSEVKSFFEERGYTLSPERSPSRRAAYLGLQIPLFLIGCSSMVGAMVCLFNPDIPGIPLAILALMSVHGTRFIFEGLHDWQYLD